MKMQRDSQYVACFIERFKLNDIGGQSYKAFYDRNLQLYSRTDCKFAHIMTLELKFTIVKCL